MSSTPSPEQLANMDAEQLRLAMVAQMGLNRTLREDLAHQSREHQTALNEHEATAKSRETVLRATLRERETQLQEKTDELRGKTDELQAQAANIQYLETVAEKLKIELAILRRVQFSKTAESFTTEQLNLFNETVDGDISEIEQQELDKLPEQDKKHVQHARPKRKPLPAELPRTTIQHEPESTTCSCGCQLKRIGEDISEKLDHQPGTFSVEQHVRGKWVCDACETLIQAPVPAHVIDKGMATTNLLSQVLVNKFADHLPLYRQEQMFARTGYRLASSTLGSWVGQCGAQLQPLVQALQEAILEQGVLHADETPVTMLCAKQILKGKSNSKKAYVWAYSTTQYAPFKAVIFDFAESRAGKHAQLFLQDWQGALICDDYSGYKELIKQNQITEAGCMAHARRQVLRFGTQPTRVRLPMKHWCNSRPYTTLSAAFKRCQLMNAWKSAKRRSNPGWTSCVIGY